MLFNSWGYLIFWVLLAVPLYWSIPHRLRVHFLWIASILFYSMWRWEFSLLMVVASFVDFHAARFIHASSNNKTRRRWLMASLSINLGMLVFFKYTYFIHDNFRVFSGLFGFSFRSLQEMGVNIILPFGISFFTFQTINYTIDVYRRVIQPTEHFATFFAYVTFWPHLMAGPILRAAEIIPQIENKKKFNWDNLKVGSLLVLSGLAKKVLIADVVATRVDAAFAIDSMKLSSFDVWIAAYLFGFQIYFDFAGYSDIAVGTARLMGYQIPENFKWPYLATSPRDFWKRWHISLSEWIRDYLYLPLTGQKDFTQGNRNRALFLTWFIMGLWHGAGWNFVVWGLYHAGLIYLFRVVKPLQTLEKRSQKLSWFLMLNLSMLGWIPFRASSLKQTYEWFSCIFDLSRYELAKRSLQNHSYTLVFALVSGMLLFSAVNKLVSKHKKNSVESYAGLAIASASLFFLILIYLKPIRQFIYFQF